jgi:DNA repair photolyase
MLAEAGIPTGAMLAPIIPGLNDSEIPVILQAAKSAGAQTANYVLLRLPLTVEPVFREWLERTQPLKAEMVLGKIRQTRGGRLNNSTWHDRMVGTGPIAEQIKKMFQLFRRKQGLDGKLTAHDCSRFRPPAASSGQLRLF